MFLRLWNYFRGYVIIEVSGFSVERFMNLAANRKIFLWDIKRSTNKVLMKVSIKGYKLLKPCALKSRCRIKIKDKFGFPFLLHRYRKRKLLMAGVVLFVMALYALSSFVWLIEVNGAERVKSVEIVNFLRERGLDNGTFKYSLDTKSLEAEILDNFSDVSWVFVGIKGTKVTVNLAETIEKVNKPDLSTPCDIYAKKDGLIESIATSAGTPVVKAGDVVKAGELLVKGELLIGSEDSGFKKAYVHAASEVRAKMYYEMKFDVPLNYESKKFTGDNKVIYSILAFDNEIVLPGKINYLDYEKITTRTQIKFGDNYPLPVIIIKHNHKEFKPITLSRTVTEAEKIAKEMINARLIREYEIETDILNKEISFNHFDDKISVTAFITTVERIDEEQIIEVKEDLDLSIENDDENMEE